jgi:general stress protein 26
MAKLGLKDISDTMRQVDICMLTTNSGALESRPMSNNRDVDYDGDSFFFTEETAELVADIQVRPEVNLAYTHNPVLGKSLYISVSGKADVVRDRAEMAKHWVKDLDVWFKDGVDTPGLAMIHVKADRVKYWQGEDNGEVKV